MSAASVIVQPADVLPIKMRPLRETDWPFIKSSWIHASLGGKHNKQSWKTRLDARVELLKARSALFRIAADRFDTGHVFGWICAEPPVLHFAYVKLYYRRNGLFWSLVAATPLAGQTEILCSDWTSDMSKAARRRPSLFRKVLPC